MYICPTCKAEVEDGANFCPVCGAKIEIPQVQEVIPEVPVEAPIETVSQAPVEVPVQTPVYTLPVYQQPQKPSKAKAIVGMALSIGGLVFAIIGAFYAFICSLIPEAEGAFVGGIFGIVFGIIALPLAIVGLVMSNKSRKEWACGMNKTGKVIGLVAVIITAVMMMSSFIAIANTDFDDFGDIDNNDYGYYNDYNYNYGNKNSYKF